MTKHRATKTQDVSSEWGRPAWVYSDGSVRGERGKMLKALTGGTQITRTNRPAYAEARANKVQEAIRSALMQAGGVDKIPAASPAAVIGAAAGVMWKQAFVDGKDQAGQPVYMRDKLAVWQEVGKRAGLLEDQRSEAPAASAIAGLLGLALGLAAQRGEAGVLQATEPPVDAVVTDDEAETK